MNLMQITLTVDLTDDDAAAIANVKHTQPDDVAEIKDYLTGYLEGAIEAAQSDAHGDVAVGVAPVAVGARCSPRRR
jgi:AICAR transformylase/IMP cyclohydrolase PurH